MIIVNIQTYGDYDVPGTALLMVAPQLMSRKIAKELKKEAEELFKDTDEIDGVITYLKSWGFTTANTISITVGNDL